MKKEHIMDAMDYIDPSLVAAADAPAPRRGKVRRLRPALVAACLCAALVGTAFAVQQFAVRVDLNGTEMTGYGDYGNYTVSGGIGYYPADSFSQEARELAVREAARSFHTWDELEQFIGRNLMDNPVLEGSEPGVPTSIETMEGTPTHIMLVPSADQDGELSTLLTWDSYYVDEVVINRIAMTLTDRAQEQYEEYGVDPASVLYYEKGSQVTLEQYTTPGGFTAAIVQVEDSLCTTYQASLSINGVRCIISARPMVAGQDIPEDPAHTLSVLKTVLDGFDAN